MSRESSEGPERLESWKAIAAFFGRSVRTVRRWEKSEGLPVHRHQHSAGSTVFAYRAELERWRRGRVAEATGPVPTPVTTVEPAAERPPSWLTLRSVAAIALVALLLASIALYRSLPMGDTGERWDDWVHRVPLRQRLLFEATYNQSQGDHAAALDSFEALLATGAVDVPVLRILLDSCGAVREPAACAELVAEAADQFGPSQELQFEAAHALTMWAGDLDRAAVYAERSRRLMEIGQIDLDPEAFQFIQLFRARVAWLEGNLDGSLVELDRLEKALSSWGGDLHDAVARAAGAHCLALGRSTCAESWFERLSSAEARHEAIATVLFARGESEALAVHLDSGEGYREPFSAVLLAMTKRLDAAGELAQRLTGRLEPSGSALVALGSVDLLGGDVDLAVERLERGVAGIETVGVDMHFVGLDMLSMVAQQRGDLDAAVDWLEMTSDQRTAAVFQGAGLFWIKCQDRLAGLYRENSQTDAAVRIERQLLATLALADTDEPISTALRRRAT